MALCKCMLCNRVIFCSRLVRKSQDLNPLAPCLYNVEQLTRLAIHCTLIYHILAPYLVLVPSVDSQLDQGGYGAFLNNTIYFSCKELDM